MKQLIKYFLSFFSQHVELEQTIENLQQDLCDLQEHAARLQYEYEWANKKSCDKGEQLDYANMVISHNEQTIESLTNSWFGEFCRANKADEAISEGEYSPEYFNKIFKGYKSHDDIRTLTTRELRSIYIECGWCSMSKFRNELSLIQRSKATTPDGEAIRSLDILCRKKLVFQSFFGHSCGDKIVELMGSAI